MEMIANGLLALAIGVPAFLGLMLLIVASRVTRLAWRRVTLRTVGRDTLPAGTRAAFDAARPALESLGFHYRCTTAQQGMAVAEGDEAHHCDIYQHADGSTHAQVVKAPATDPEPYRVGFVSLLRSKRALVTVNCRLHELVVRPPRTDLQDPCLRHWQDAWKFHRRRVQAAQGEIVTDGLAFMQFDKEATELLVTNAEKRGELRREGSNWYATWRTALAFAVRYNLGLRRVARVRSGLPARAAPPAAEASPGTAPATRVQAEIEEYRKHVAILRSLRWSKARKWKMFGLSALLFLGVGSLWFSWTFLPILLLVIGLHEGGHFLAMKLSGYGNLSVFFVPGLGGLASGEKPTAGPWEKLLVYLAGPVPGIALAGAGLAGMAFGAFTPSGWFMEFLIACLIINYLNLLPVSPLDGGRVVETFLFARLPAARFAFAVLGVALLVAFGLYAHDKVLLVVGVLLAFAIPHQWQVMQLDRAIDRTGGETVDEQGALERIFGALQEPRFARWGAPQRLQVAGALLPEVQGRRARPLESVGGLAVYLLFLLGPVLLAAQAFPGGWQTAMLVVGLRTAYVPDDVDPDPPAAEPPAPTRDWIAEAGRLDRVPEPERLRVLLEAARQAEEMDDLEQRDRLARSAGPLADARAPGDLDRARTLLLLGDTSEPAARQHLAQLVQEQAGATDPLALDLLATAKQRLAMGTGVPAAEEVALLEQAVEHLRQARADRIRLLAAEQSLGRAYHRHGYMDAAESVLRGQVRAHVLPAEGDRTRRALENRVGRMNADVDLAWFLMDRGRGAEAARILQEARARAPRKETTSWSHPLSRLREAELWSAWLAKDAHALRPAWERYESGREAVGVQRRNLALELDRLVVARALGDAALEASARQAIEEERVQPQAQYFRASFCRREPAGWQRLQMAARADAARELGICART